MQPDVEELFAQAYIQGLPMREVLQAAGLLEPGINVRIVYMRFMARKRVKAIIAQMREGAEAAMPPTIFEAPVLRSKPKPSRMIKEQTKVADRVKVVLEREPQAHTAAEKEAEKIVDKSVGAAMARQRQATNEFVQNRLVELLESPPHPLRGISDHVKLIDKAFERIDIAQGRLLPGGQKMDASSIDWLQQLLVKDANGNVIGIKQEYYSARKRKELGISDPVSEAIDAHLDGAGGAVPANDLGSEESGPEGFS